jgi:ribonuclease P protein component
MRVGLIVPRYRHTAVARNQLKRRLRELARVQLLPTHLPIDIVIRVRPEAYDAGFERLRADVDRARAQLARLSGTGTTLDIAPSSPPSAT